ncbi:alpha/beta hydrolase [Trinickia sp. YCB016]
MTIDSQLLDLYAAIAEHFAPLPLDADANTRRQRMADVGRRFARPRRADVESVDITVPLAGRTLRARMYRPAGSTGPLPLVVYFHGGGWVVGDLDTHDSIAAGLAADGGLAVASVEYRLAPEHPFPAPVDDAIDALSWFAEQRARLGFALDTLAVAGDSAGAHLATVAARTLNERVAGLVKAQLLLYPVTQFDFDTDSYTRHANGVGLTRDEMRWYWAQFLSGARPREDDPRAFPLTALSERVPAPAVVFGALHDPLYDDAALYARYLEAHGGRVEWIEASDMTHAFGRMQSESAAARAWMRTAAQRLAGLLT